MSIQWNTHNATLKAALDALEGDPDGNQKLADAIEAYMKSIFSEAQYTTAVNTVVNTVTACPAGAGTGVGTGTGTGSGTGLT